MTVADGSQTRLAYVLETSPGIIPATPEWQTLRYVSETLALNKQTDIPDEITGGRDVTDIVDVGRSVGGAVNTLLSYGTFDDLLSGLLCNDWDNDVLVNGRTAKTFAFEKTFDLGASKAYDRFLGVRMNSLDLSFQTRQSVTANWSVMGLNVADPSAAIIAGATYEAATTTPVLNAALNIGSLTIGGVAASPKLQSASITINNNIYQNDVLGSYAPYGHGLGRLDVSGSITALFESVDLYKAIIAHDDLSLSLTIGAAANSRYKLTLEKIKGTNGNPQVAGNNRAVLLTMPFQAKYGPNIGGSIKLERNVA